LAVPSALTAHIVTDSIAQKRINQADDRVKGLQKKLDNALSKTDALEDLEKNCWNLAKELNMVRSALDLAVGEHQKASDLNLYLQQSLSALQADLEASQGKVEELQAECEVWEEEFADRVESAADAKFQIANKAEIQKIFDEHDAITSQAMQLFQELQQWGQKVAHGHETKREIIQNLARSYNENILDFGESVKKEHAAHVACVEQLNERIAMLQQQLAGDLVEPEYLAVAYSVEGRISNDIAREVFIALQIPLAVKGYHTKPDGSTDVALGYSRSMGSVALVEALKRQSEAIARELRIHKITSIRKLEIADLIVVTFRREPAIKEDTLKHLVGTPDEFIDYIVNQPIRYRIIADPNAGKSPSLAVMVSEILKVGGRVANKTSGARVPNTLVSVSYPGIHSSLKDAIYPLDGLVQYGDITASIKAIQDAENDWHYRERDINYAKQIFQLWCWDEFDNTMDSASDPKSLAESLKKILKQSHHSSVGWIVSGQSVMTKQIPGFTNDDRSLFTEIVIGIPKIRKYLKSYGKDVAGDKKMQTILSNLDDIEDYVERENSRITDDARLLRVALIRDERSPKLYFLPNLDKVNIDYENQQKVITLATQLKTQFLTQTSGQSGSVLGNNSQNDHLARLPELGNYPPNLPIGLPTQSTQSAQKPHCPHCGSHVLEVVENSSRYQCNLCKTPGNRPKRFVVSKAIWK
jgi:hypothetical protein